MPRRTTASAEPPAEQPDDGTSGQTAATATVEPEPNPTPEAEPAPAAEAGFFSWLRGIDLPRRSGWLGGVCAGIAERLGIDPLLVRGIVVVLAVVGAPATLLYAIAWFLLPDEDGTIHAQQLGHGRVTPALPGIVVLFLLSFLPLTQGFWYAGALYWGDTGWAGSLARIAWTGVLVIAVVVLVVWIARRAATDVPTTPATTDDRPETVPTFPDAGTDADAGAAAEAGVAAALVTASASVAPVTAPGEPPAPPADASAEELAAWKSSQQEWQQQRAAWAAEQKRSERERRQAAAHEAALVAAEAARERARIRKLTRPRASAGVVFLILGVGLVAGALAAFAASHTPDTRGAEWLIGAAVLVLVLGVGAVIVGLARRRSGALAFFSILSVLALAVAVVVPADRQLLPLGAGWGLDSSVNGRYAQFAGNTSLYVPDRGTEPVVIDLWQLAGSVSIELQEGATVRLFLTTDSPSKWVSVEEQSYDGLGRYGQYQVRDGRLQLTAGDGDPDVVLRLWAGRATSVYIRSWSESEVGLTLDPLPDEWWQIESDGSTSPVPTPSSIPTDVTTEGAP